MATKKTLTKSRSASSIASARLTALEGKTRQSTESLLDKVASGILVDEFIFELKKYGRNEFGDEIRWNSPILEESLRLFADLRINEVFLSGAAQLMKMQRYDEPIATSQGYKQAKDIKVGNYLISVEGSPTKVIGVHPQPVKDFYKLTFNDGSSVETCSEHLWSWYAPSTHSASKLAKGNKGNSKAAMLWTSTTQELYDDAIASGGFRQTKSSGKLGRYKYAIPMLESPAEMNSGFDCAGISPYLLGLLIGGGSYSSSVRITGDTKDLLFYQQNIDEESRILKSKNRTDYLSIARMMPRLKSLGIFGRTRQVKRIPEQCYGMHWQKRLELLRGLMDSDGSNVHRAGASFCSAVKELADGVAEIVRGLGGYAKVTQGERFGYAYVGKAEKTTLFYTVSVQLPEYLNPFKLPRKALTYKHSPSGKQIKAIESIEPATPSDGVCFTVEHPRSLYLMNNGIITHNTLVAAQTAAWMSQRAGMRVMWAFAKARQIDALVPTQHKPVLMHWAQKVNGITKFTNEHQTSNSQFSVGNGSIKFVHVNSNTTEGGAAAGTSIVSNTVDLCIMEETSQVQQREIAPLYKRLLAGRIKSRPMRQIGTPGSGNGVELPISKSDFEFWPHAKCSCCEKMASLHPFGALFISEKIRAEDGSVLDKWAYDDGMPRKWFHTDDSDPVGSAFVGCVHCGAKIPDEARYQSTLICIHTGMRIKEFLEGYVPEHWEKENIKVGAWCGALTRVRTNIATDIMQTLSPEGLSDFYEQTLGIPSSASQNSITSQSIINALERPLFTPQRYSHLREIPEGSEGQTEAPNDLSRFKSVRAIGIDQGRSAFFGAVVEAVYDSHLPPAQMFSTAKFNIIALECFPSFATAEFIAKFEGTIGLIDNEPSISAAARLCAETGLHLADQQAKQKDDYLIKTVQDGGEQFECVKINYRKFARFIFSAFAGSSVSMNREYMRFLGAKDNEPGNVFRHLTGVSWDSEEGFLVRDKSKIDDLFFAMLFSFAAISVYMVDPNQVSLGRCDWSWMDSF